MYDRPRHFDGPVARAVTTPVLVSVIVRSMGRPELRLALESIARQDHPAIETVIVDATGGRHPPLPSMHWREGHAVRMVDRGEPLKRPQAAALGLESARGDWIAFLDDDDTCEPAHLSTLIAAVEAHPGALIVYGRGRLYDAAGHLQSVFGLPFNRALMHYGPLFYWQSALISARVRELGCRFDPALEVCEDRDFLAQIAEHGEFAFIPDAATFNYRPDLGTSGTGGGANRNVARVARFENMLRAKWAGTGIYHNERAATRCREGIRAYFAGNLDGSRSAFQRVLSEYPDDPNALHGLARVALVRGDLATGERVCRQAIAINPTIEEYRATLAEILLAAGTTLPREGPRSPSRTAPCPCGSGRRYKACCGQLEIRSSDQRQVRIVQDQLLERVERALRRGEASEARTLLEPAVADPGATRRRLVAAADLELALGNAQGSFPLLQRAAALLVDADVGHRLEACCQALADREGRASLWAMASTVCLRSASIAPSSIRSACRGVRPVIRIEGPFLAGSPELREAVLLRRLVGDAADVALVSNAQNDALMQAGANDEDEWQGAQSTLILFGPDDMPVFHADAAHPSRIVVRLSRNDPEALLRCLVRLHEACPEAVLQFTVPSAEVARAFGQHMPVEYPWVDPALFALEPAAGGSSLVVGRHGPIMPGEHHHPDDGALYRGLIADGHRVEVPATAFLHQAFEEDPPAARPCLVEDDGSWSALQRLEVALFRGAPDVWGAGDARILEAMAAGRPVVGFVHSLGAREWIDNARTGFLVETSIEARRCVAQLARTPRLRREIGLAAREVAAAIMDAQRSRARAFYLGVSLNV